MQPAETKRTLPRPDLSPTCCLEADSADARVLRWLPFAVRFKLDVCGLRMSLAEWQRLPLVQRGALVRAPLEGGAGGFHALAHACGARADADQRAGTGTGDLAFLREDDIEDWLACATPFAKYVARKIVFGKERHEAA